MSTTSPELRRITILLVDEESLVRSALQNLLESWHGFEVVGEAESGVEALDRIKGLQPDLILLTIRGDEEDLEIVPELAAASEHGRVLVLTAESDQELWKNLVRLGARGVILKKKAADELRKAIQKVHEGEIWLDRRSTASLITEVFQPGPSLTWREASRLRLLTDRERQVILLVTKGNKNKQIAKQLFISEITVRHHLTTIFNKLKVSSRFELITYLYRHRIISPDHPNRFTGFPSRRAYVTPKPSSGTKVL